jgi:hypothetical protein
MHTRRVFIVPFVLDSKLEEKKEEFEDTKGLNRIRKSKKDRQDNGQKKKVKRTNNDLQIVAHKTKDRVPLWYRYKYCYSDSHNERGRFGTLKSDSTHHFFRNACTKSGSLRFSQFSGW